MTDEERQRAIDFIVTQSAKNSVEIEKLIESHSRAEKRLGLTDHRLDRAERILKLMIQAGSRARKQLREQDQRWERRHTELVESQAHTDKRLDALIDIVRAEHNGRSQ